MNHEGRFLDPHAVARLESLQIVARTLVEGFLHGPHLSRSKGSSLEFAEHRPYVPGDEIRRIDWRAFARSDRFYLKEYEDESNLRAILAVDASASMGYGRSVTKLRYAACLGAALGYLLYSQRDAVGLALVREGLETLIPARATAEHLAGLLSFLETLEPAGRTRLAGALHALAERTRPRSLTIVLSDLIEEPRAILTGLAHLVHRPSEAIVFHILDPDELDPPFRSWITLKDPEGELPALRGDAGRLKPYYLEGFEAHCAVLRRGCAAAAIDYVQVRTDEPFETALARYLHARARRRRSRNP